MFLILLQHELKLYTKNRSEFINLLLFYIIILVLFQFALDAELRESNSQDHFITWISSLLYSLLVLKFVFEEDLRDGTLEQLVIKFDLIEKIVISKFCVHYICCFIPLAVLILFFNQLTDAGNSLFLLATMMVGMACLSGVNIITASLTAGLRSASAVGSIVALPLYIPVLIFGIVGSRSTDYASFTESILILSALFLIISPLALYTATYAVKLALEE